MWIPVLKSLCFEMYGNRTRLPLSWFKRFVTFQTWLDLNRIGSKSILVELCLTVFFCFTVKLNITIKLFFFVATMQEDDQNQNFQVRGRHILV